MNNLMAYIHFSFIEKNLILKILNIKNFFIFYKSNNLLGFLKRNEKLNGAIRVELKVN